MALSLGAISIDNNPPNLGIGNPRPRISWRFQGNATAWEQSSYELEILRDGLPTPRSHAANTSQSLYIPWPEEPLGSSEAVEVRVRAHGDSDEGKISTDWPEWLSFETAL